MLHRNLKTKVFSLFLAIVLWCYLLLTSKNPVVERTWHLQVDLRRVPAGHVGTVTPAAVKLVVHGREQVMSALDVSRFKVSADSADLVPGEHWIKVRTDQPEGVTVRVEPTQVKVTIERVLRRIKPVEFKLEGEPPPGYELGNPTGEPAMVTVYGAESRVDEVRRALAVINLARITPGLAQLIPVVPVDVHGAKLEQVEVSPARISIRVPVKAVRIPRALPVVVETTGMAAPGYRVASVGVEPAVVTVIGPSDVVSEMLTVHTQSFTIAGLDHDHEVSVPLRLPAGVATLELSQAKVRIHVVRLLPGEASGGPR